MNPTFPAECQARPDTKGQVAREESKAMDLLFSEPDRRYDSSDTAPRAYMKAVNAAEGLFPSEYAAARRAATKAHSPNMQGEQ